MQKTYDAFRTISEVAQELGVPKHVLRFWEGKFPQIKPMKRGGGRRYYRPEDLQLLSGIRKLLHADGYTIKGVQKILREQGVETVKQVGQNGTASRQPAKRSGRRNQKADAGGLVASASLDRGKLLDRMQGPDGRMKETAHVQRQHIEAAIRELESCRALLAGNQPVAKTAKARSGRKAKAARSSS